MYIYGASDQGRVVIDMIDGYEKIHGVFDDNPKVFQVLDYPVLGSVPADFIFDHQLFIAIGENGIRKMLHLRYQYRAKFATIIHESALFSRRANLDDGTVVMEGAIVKVNTELGKQVIINTGASVDHDCTIGDYVHIAPQATLCGGIVVGEGTLIGANSTVLPGVKIGNWCKIGAGSVVTADVPDGETWIGNGLKSKKVYR
ncbi:acetyltransferase [Cyclobacterium sp. SYSU L10401]|uniref:acetyltransferase n=1 Tax=Cyclobacterium sp. SYSU L10401 TaxID=2678657 RepID=UPI0013D0F938|nr:acetyltransferase [Cyclobacterium sp. SYSU L10401]